MLEVCEGCQSLDDYKRDNDIHWEESHGNRKMFGGGNHQFTFGHGDYPVYMTSI